MDSAEVVCMNLMKCEPHVYKTDSTVIYTAVKSHASYNMLALTAKDNQKNHASFLWISL